MVIDYTIRPMNSMGNSPLHCFFHYRVNFLIRSNMVSDTMTVHKAFRKFPDGGADRAQQSRNANLNLVYFREDK